MMQWWKKTRVLQEEAFAFDHYWSASDETSRLVHMDNGQITQIVKATVDLYF